MIFQAIRSYPLLQFMIDSGINKESSDEDIKRVLNYHNISRLQFELDGAVQAEIRFNTPWFNITSFRLSSKNTIQYPVDFKPKDLQLNISGLIEKFGAPSEIEICEDIAIIVRYNNGYSELEITMMNTKQPFRNRIYCNDGNRSNRLDETMLEPSFFTINGLGLGASLTELIKTNGLPNNSEELKLTLGLTEKEIIDQIALNEDSPKIEFIFDDVCVDIWVNKDNLKVSDLSINYNEEGLYKVTKKKVSFEVPKFNSEEVLTEKDMYLSHLTQGSSRKAVFEQLGAPLKTNSFFDDYFECFAQRCTFKDGEVLFLGVDDFDDLETGNAAVYYIKAPYLIGPRGIKVGDPIKKVLAVIPGNNDIDFNDKKSQGYIYPYPFVDYSSHEAYNEFNPGKPNSGVISIKIDYRYIVVKYVDGIITEIVLSEDFC